MGIEVWSNVYPVHSDALEERGWVYELAVGYPLQAAVRDGFLTTIHYYEAQKAGALGDDNEGVKDAQLQDV